MIKTPTVLILGAGASAPYGLPVGNDYKYEILRVLGGSEQHIWDQLEVERSDIDEVRDAFYRSGQKSVDLWLQRWIANDTDMGRRARYLRIGKTAIALVILRAERQVNLWFDRKRVGGWYDYLWQFIDASPTEFSKNQLSIITFNYDRSFEYALYYALKNSYGNPSDEVVGKCLSQVNIHHVYGYVAPPHYLGIAEGLEYGKFQATSSLETAIANIKIVGEREDAYERMRTSGPQDWLRNSRRVIFLGFGFDAINVGMLNIKEVATGKSMWSSGKDLDSADIARISELFSAPLVESPILGTPDDDVLAYLKKYAESCLRG